MTAPPPRIVADHPLAVAWFAALGTGLVAIAIPYLASASVTLGILAVVVWFTRSFGRDRPRPRSGPLLLVAAAAVLGAVFIAAAPPELAPVRALGFAAALAPLATLGGAVHLGPWRAPKETP
ncbi:MAG: hypothetical protein ACYCPN_04530 [Thermoplasmata archaeon]